MKKQRNSIALTTDSIIIKSSPGVAVCSDQLPRVPVAAVCNVMYSVTNNKSLRSKPFNV